MSGSQGSGDWNHFPIPRVPQTPALGWGMEGGGQAGCQPPDLTSQLISTVLTLLSYRYLRTHFTPEQLRIEPQGNMPGKRGLQIPARWDP